MKHRLKQFSRTRLALLRMDSSPQQSGLLIAPARDMTAPLMNRMITLARGNVLVALSANRAEAFYLPPMASRARQELQTGTYLANSPVSVEAREGVTTGISASDRAKTVSLLGAKEPNPRMLVQPGHVFPVSVREGGTLVKHSLPEGAHDLVKLAFSYDGATFLDLLDDYGEHLLPAAQDRLGQEQQIPIFSLSEIVRYRLETEKLVQRVAEAKLPTQDAGEMTSYIYESFLHTGEHLALVKGEIDPDKPTLVRVQPEFTFGDVFGGSNPPTQRMLRSSLREIGENGSGVLVYLRRPDLGQLCEQVENWEKRFGKQPAAVMQEYGLGAQILRDLGVRSIEVLTGSKNNLIGLNPFGIEIVSQRPLPPTESSPSPSAQGM